MSWNHRVMKHVHPNGDVEYAIHEVYYDGDGQVDGWTRDPVAPMGDTLHELRAELRRMDGATDKPVLPYGPEEPNDARA